MMTKEEEENFYESRDKLIAMLDASGILSKPEEPKSITVYMDLVGWQHEVENCSEGVKVYGNIKDLKNHCRAHWQTCGIAELTLTFKAIAEPQNFEED